LTASTNTELTFEVAPEDAGARLDVWLVRCVPEMSRARAKAWIASDRVRRNGRRARKGERVAAGDEIALAEVPSPKDFDALAEEAPLEVRLETRGFVVVEKPPHMASHPLRADETGTLANALVQRYPEMRGVGYRAREPGLLHRLDTGTSGLMLAARTPASFEVLRKLLTSGAIEKRYLALCDGEVPLGPITAAIAHDPGDRRRMRTCAPMDVERLAAREARTEVLDVSLSTTKLGPVSTVTARAYRARRHQVRVHLADLGFPLLGDALYGGPSLSTLSRHALHASRIAFELDDQLVQVDSALPPDLEAALA